MAHMQYATAAAVLSIWSRLYELQHVGAGGPLIWDVFSLRGLANLRIWSELVRQILRYTLTIQ